MGTIINGKFYPDVTPEQQEKNTTVNNIATEGDFSRQVEEHAHDLIQPHNPDGTPNQDFIDYYPEDAKNYGFIPQEDKE